MAKKKVTNKAKPKKKRSAAVAKVPKKIGRPRFEYSDELADKICLAISTSTYGLKQICQNKKDFPSATMIYSWLNDKQYTYFQNCYARARELQMEMLADQIIELSDRNREGITTTTGVGEFGAFNSETRADNYNRTRLQIDARKWLASKLHAKKFGDLSKVEVTGADGQPLIPITAIEIVHSEK
jgi:hypothetical protein